eukprot:CAMPEP_0170527752 /NCGR_PEP_ID=MMETSP0209-20121228/13233_1 /TAXON_ID=665100 ORGANISM="Litonotus pictus, Strain P1" /NCGR_SAMPLE_ID=MMETSP0209 /ASSEMBLY_ACC=CAM_ASM_000301 /LENGTH=102 /DNA_ID=CAMNT_0010818493 /DNA_START=726 /DNA_END=1034 /DNA_ORIENTATION=+
MNPDYKEYKFPLIKCFTWKKILGHLSNVDDLFIDLLTKIFVYDPNKRINSFEGLTHPYFDSLRNKGVNDHEMEKVLFEFTTEEKMMNSEYMKQLIPDWYKNK